MTVDSEGYGEQGSKRGRLLEERKKGDGEETTLGGKRKSRIYARFCVRISCKPLKKKWKPALWPTTLERVRDKESTSNRYLC